VPEDRFADLGPAGDDKRSAAEKFEELDRSDPEPGPKPEPPRPSGRYMWVVGIVAVIVLVLAGISTLPKEGAGFRGVPQGHSLAPFAAPLVSSRFDKPASIQRRPGGGHPAACQIRGPGIVNLCDLRSRPLVMTFIANGGAGCDQQLDRVERLRARFPQVTFLGVITLKPLSEAKSLAARHGWRLPIALDNDGRLLNLYGVGDCPTTIFVRRGGVSAGSRNGKLTEAQVAAGVRAILK
jgi:AhpC/TSA family